MNADTEEHFVAVGGKRFRASPLTQDEVNAFKLSVERAAGRLAMQTPLLYRTIAVSLHKLDRSVSEAYVAANVSAEEVQNGTTIIWALTTAHLAAIAAVDKARE